MGLTLVFCRVLLLVWLATVMSRSFGTSGLPLDTPDGSIDGSLQEKKIFEWDSWYMWIQPNMTKSFRSTTDQDNTMLPLPRYKHHPLCQNYSQFVDIFKRSCHESDSHDYIKHVQENIIDYPCPSSKEPLFRGSLMPSPFKVNQPPQPYKHLVYVRNGTVRLLYGPRQPSTVSAFIESFAPQLLESKESEAGWYVQYQEHFTITLDAISKVEPSKSIKEAYDALPDSFETHEESYNRFIDVFGVNYRRKVVFGGFVVFAATKNNTITDSTSIDDILKSNQFGTHIMMSSGGKKANNYATWSRTIQEHPVPIFEIRYPIGILLDPGLKNVKKLKSFEAATKQYQNIINLRKQVQNYAKNFSNNKLADFVSETLQSELKNHKPNFNMFELISKNNSKQNFQNFWIKCNVKRENATQDNIIRIMYVIEGVCVNFYPLKCDNITIHLPSKAQTLSVFKDYACMSHPSYKRELNTIAQDNQYFLTYAFSIGKSMKIDI